MNNICLLIFGFLLLSENAFCDSNVIQTEVCDWDGEESSEEGDQIMQDCFIEIHSGLKSGLGLDDIGLRVTQGQFRRKRNSQSSSLSEEEVILSGCILQCMFRKYGSLNDDGLVSRSKLIKMINEGINDADYMAHSEKAVEKCMTYYDNFYMHPWRVAKFGRKQGLGIDYCRLSFHVFDCISDELYKYCEQSSSRK